MATDFSKASNTVNHTKLLQTVSNSTLLQTMWGGWQHICGAVQFPADITIPHLSARQCGPVFPKDLPSPFSFPTTLSPHTLEFAAAHGLRGQHVCCRASVDTNTAATALTVHAEAVEHQASELDLWSLPKNCILPVPPPTLDNTNSYQSLPSFILHCNLRLLPESKGWRSTHSSSLFFPSKQ